MKIVYIAHPISGNIEENLADLRRIVRVINLESDDIVPFVPYYIDIVSLDDTLPEERARGILNNTEMIKSGLINEMWLTGNKISSGMIAERALAQEYGIKVINMINSL